MLLSRVQSGVLNLDCSYDHKCLTLGRIPVVPVFTGSENFSFSDTADTGSACDACTNVVSPSSNQ